MMDGFYSHAFMTQSKMTHYDWLVWQLISLLFTYKRNSRFHVLNNITGMGIEKKSSCSFFSVIEEKGFH